MTKLNHMQTPVQYKMLHKFVFDSTSVCIEVNFGILEFAISNRQIICPASYSKPFFKENYVTRVVLNS
jgi:hypothetical protein